MDKKETVFTKWTAIVIGVLVAVCVFLDQISKYLVVIYLGLGESVDVIPGVLRFTYVRNDGAAFGSFDDARWLFMVLSSVAIIAIFVFIAVKKPTDKLMLAAIILIASGGIGNMIDRIRLGYVIDFIDFCAFPKIWMWVFNIADSCVCIGAGLLILWMVIDLVRESKRERELKAASVATAESSTEEISDTATEEIAAEETATEEIADEETATEETAEEESATEENADGAEKPSPSDDGEIKDGK